jgi:hypothetical protein
VRQTVIARRPPSSLIGPAQYLGVSRALCKFRILANAVRAIKALTLAFYFYYADLLTFSLRWRPPPSARGLTECEMLALAMIAN